MSFLAPLFFTALAALSIPVLIHLIQREKKQVVYFPSLMFLEKIPYRSVQRRRIHNWLLLLLRMAAIVLIITAFARPFFNETTLASAAAAGSREVVILLDRSYSMGYGDRWTRAQAAARDAIDGLQAGDRASLVFFARGADVAARSTDDRAQLRLAVDGATVSAESTRYAPALKVAQTILQQSQRPRREVMLISDFQRVGWDGAQDAGLPAGSMLTPVVITDEQPANVVVSSVALPRDESSDQSRVVVTAGLQNKGDEPVRDLDVSLDIDGLEAQSQQVSLEANASGFATFPAVVLPPTPARARIRLADDALAIDNTFYFTLSRGRPIRVLIVERAGAGRDLSFYLQGALGVGTDPEFDVDVTSVDRLGAGDLADRAVVVLNDVPLGGGLADRFARFVEQGGGLFVVLGDRSTWPEGLEIMPGRIGPVVDLDLGRTVTVGYVDFSHRVFDLFRAPRSGDFGSTQVYRYRALDLWPEAHVLSRFDDGGVALAERDTGRGRVLVWAGTLDNLWSDLVVKPVFLPFVHRVAMYLADYEEPTPWQTVGQVFVEAPSDRTRVALTPSGERLLLSRADEAPPAGEAVPAEGTGETEGEAEAARPSEDDLWVQLDEPGFYEIRDAAGGGGPVTEIAVNVDTTESDLTTLDPQELVGAVTGRASSGETAAAEEVTLRPVDLERRQSLWWYLLLLGVVLLAAETWLSNRLSRATSELRG